MFRLPRWTTATTTRVAPSTVPVDVRMTIPFWSRVAVPVSSAPAPVRSASPALMSFRMVTPKVPDAAVRPGRVVPAGMSVEPASSFVVKSAPARLRNAYSMPDSASRRAREPGRLARRDARLDATHRREADGERGHDDHDDQREGQRRAPLVAEKLPPVLHPAILPDAPLSGSAGESDPSWRPSSR